MSLGVSSFFFFFFSFYIFVLFVIYVVFSPLSVCCSVIFVFLKYSFYKKKQPKQFLFFCVFRLHSPVFLLCFVFLWARISCYCTSCVLQPGLSCSFFFGKKYIYLSRFFSCACVDVNIIYIYISRVVFIFQQLIFIFIMID